MQHSRQYRSALAALAMAAAILGPCLIARAESAVPPTITSFSPTSGKFPDFVTIAGTGFTGATEVTIGGVPSAKITVVSATEIRALVRSLARTGKITVTTPAGTVTSTNVFAVTWTANEPTWVAPTIASFTPTSGKFPDWVTIAGTNFKGATQVTIGGIPCAQIAVDSPTQVRAQVRSNANTGQIVISTPAGTATSSGTFTVTKRFD